MYRLERKTLLQELLPGHCNCTHTQKSGQTTRLDILFLTLITSSAGALELDSMLWRLRSQRVIIIILSIDSK